MEGVPSMFAVVVLQLAMEWWQRDHMLQNELQDLIGQVTEPWHDCKAQLEEAGRPRASVRNCAVCSLDDAAMKHHGHLNLRTTASAKQGWHLP